MMLSYFHEHALILRFPFKKVHFLSALIGSTAYGIKFQRFERIHGES